MCKISVIIPVYKIKETYLHECIHSAVDQTLKDIEIILVDDGSPDACGAVCDEYGAEDSRIVCVHQKNQGVSCARNAGIRIAKGKYFLFLDGDDRLDLRACELLYSKMEQTGSDVLLYGHKCFNETGESDHLLGRDILFDREGIRTLQEVILNPSGELLTISPAGTVGKIFRASFVKENQLQYVPGLHRMQDNVFSLYAFQAAQKVSYFDYPGYYYRINEFSACNRYNPQIFQYLEMALKEFELFIDRYQTEGFRKLFYCKVIIILEQEYMHLYFRNRNNPAGRKALIKEYKELTDRPLYRTAIDSVNLALLSKRLRVMTFLLRYRQTALLWLILDMEDFIKKVLKINARI